MGTRCLIGVEQEGKIRAVYCHWDGYPEHVGRLLFAHYNDVESANKIIALGDISSLYESCECPEGHTFQNPVKGYTVAYGRDRGETGVEAREHYSWQGLLTAGKKAGVDFVYLLKDGKWYVQSTCVGGRYPLVEMLHAIETAGDDECTEDIVTKLEPVED